MCFCSCSSLVLAFLSLMVVSNLGVGVAHVSVGARNLASCPVESLLPIALIVNGVLAALLAVWAVWDAVRANSKWTGVPGEAERLMGPSAPDDPCVKLMEVSRVLLATASVAWAAFTLYLALRTRAVYVAGPATAPGYCDASLVCSATVLASIAVANVALVSLANVVFYVLR